MKRYSDLIVLPERAGGDCGLVGCARLDSDDAQPIARQCIRPAGHDGPCRFVVSQHLVWAEEQVVGVGGFDPPTSRSQAARAT